MPRPPQHTLRAVWRLRGVLQIALARRDEALGGGVGLLLAVFELLAHPLELRLQRNGLAGWARSGREQIPFI